jgi:hypothetical protein
MGFFNWRIIDMAGSKQVSTEYVRSGIVESLE